MNRWHADLCLLAVLGLAGACQAHTAEPLVSARPIPLQEDAPDRVTLGALRFEAGFQLGASDPQASAGLSGHLARAGRARARHGERSRRALARHARARRRPAGGLRRLAGGRRSGASAGDPAAGSTPRTLADDGSGGLVVAVEGRSTPAPHHARRRRGPPTPQPAAARLAEAGAADGNEGIEALAALPDGGLLALSEGVPRGREQLAAWRIEDDRVTPLPYLASDGFVPTGADRLDDIDLHRRAPLLAR